MMVSIHDWRTNGFGGWTASPWSGGPEIYENFDGAGGIRPFGYEPTAASSFYPFGKQEPKTTGGTTCNGQGRSNSIAACMTNSNLGWGKQLCSVFVLPDNYQVKTVSWWMRCSFNAGQGESGINVHLSFWDASKQLIEEIPYVEEEAAENYVQWTQQQWSGSINAKYVSINMYGGAYPSHYIDDVRINEGYQCQLITDTRGMNVTCSEDMLQGAYLDTDSLGIARPFKFMVETNSADFVLSELDEPPDNDPYAGSDLTTLPNRWVTVTKRYIQLRAQAGDFSFQRFAWSGPNFGEPDHERDAECPCNYAGKDGKTTKNPVSLRLGEKRLEVTDLTLNSPVGSLAFTRTYNQNAQTDPNFQMMGLGWRHNHALALTFSGTTPTRIARVVLPKGGVLVLDETSSGVFAARPGSTSTLEYENNEYVLKNADQSQYRFDGVSYQLKFIDYPNGEQLTYVYTNGKLAEVNDGYGRSLQFAYINDVGSYDHGQLWRVGDHTTTNLTGSPTGRYIEFTYTPEKDNGVAIANAKALLAQVRDVRGFIWTYVYYGQEVNENVSVQLNLMLERRTPANTVAEHLLYQFGTRMPVIQQRGIVGAAPALLQTELEFGFDNADATRETTADRATLHQFSHGVYSGQQNAAGNTSTEINPVFRPEAQTDANGNTISLGWSADGKHLRSVADALDHQTRFEYDGEDRLTESLDAEGRKTEYTYGVSNPRLPARIKVIGVDGVSVLRWQEFEYDNKGRVLEEKLLDPANPNPNNPLSHVTRTYGTSGNGSGLLESVTQVDSSDSANNVFTIYTYDSAGRVIKTQQSSLLGSCKFSYTVYDAAGNVVANICNYVNAGDAPTTAEEAAALYDITKPEENVVTTHEYDAVGRRIKTVTYAGDVNNDANALITLTAYDALDRVVRTISHYVEDLANVPNPYTAAHDAFGHGENDNENLVTDTTYNARGLVRKQVDALGNVTLYGYDDVDRLIKTIQSAAQPSYDNDYDNDPSLASYLDDPEEFEHDIVTEQVYDPNGNLVKMVDALDHVHFTAYDALNRPVKTVRSASQPSYDIANDRSLSGYVPSTDPDRDLIETTEYDAMGRVIRTQRLLENLPVEVWDVTLFGYDALGRQVKTIASASQPSYDIAADPDLSEYPKSPAADQDVISKTTYDTQGRVLYTEDTFDVKTRFVYDGLNRQVKTIANFVEQGEDPSLWMWSDTNSRWEESDGTAIGHGEQDDQNIISETMYNADGQVEATRDVVGRVTRNVYDGIGRLIRTVSNYVAQGGTNPKDWVYESGWKQASGGAAVSHGADNDENQITTTAYDSKGRVLETIDHRNNATHQVYDRSGRRVMTVVNYVQQGSTDPVEWVWSDTNHRWEDGAGNAIDFGADKDQNRISTTVYDLAGRVSSSRDAAGIETRFTYDALGRRVYTISNYVQQGTTDPANWKWSEENDRWEDGEGNPIDFGAENDQNRISGTTYDKGGQVTFSRDARGTQTAFEYDGAGRRLTVTQAADSPLETTSYTCYDKAGRVLRTVANLSVEPIRLNLYSETTGEWDYAPAHNGQMNDRDLITLYEYDRLSRQTKVTDPAGNFTLTSYFKDGQVDMLTDPEGVVTTYRYDGLRRRIRVVQSYVDQGEDPAEWVWNNGWKQSDGTTTIAHGSLNDQNVIVDVTYDHAGRVSSQREPRGNVTTYNYDKMNRRKSLTNPIGKTWLTAYDGPDGKANVTMTMPGITGSPNYQVEREFDRLGRPLVVNYGEPSIDVAFTYDDAGNRASVNGLAFTYDDLHRVSSVNGLSYEYDVSGLRTRLTMPDSLNVTYTYDAKGRLISLTDWDDQASTFAYDNAGRHVATERANGLRTRYEYDAGGRLRLLRHTKDGRTLANFAYEVDKRGNRTQAAEMLAQPATTNDVTIASSDKGIITSGVWADVSGFKETSAITASVLMGFVGDEATLTMGTGPDHGIYDIYIDGSLWQSFDGYAAAAGERNIVIPSSINIGKLSHDGPHGLEIRVRADRHPSASGNKVRFKQLVIADRGYTLHTIRYSYDKLARVRDARYAPGLNGGAADADLLRRYQYTFDLSGNRTQEIETIAGSATTTNYGYNAANQMTSAGATTLTYDNNGNLLGDGTNTYAWDRANRMRAVNEGDASQVLLTYDGLGNLVQQVTGTINPTTHSYLVDVNAPLPVVVREQASYYNPSDNYTRHQIHGPRGIHYHEQVGPYIPAIPDPYMSNTQAWMLQDGLGSVRGAADPTGAMVWSTNYVPFGEMFGATGTMPTSYGFTGEHYSGGGLYLRARHYKPTLGVFTALDKLEGSNQYAYASGNPINFVDPSGMFDWQSGLIEPGDCLYCIAREAGIGLGNNVNVELGAFRQIIVQSNPSNVFVSGTQYSNNPQLVAGQYLNIPNFAAWIYYGQTGVFRDIWTTGRSGLYANTPLSCPCGSVGSSWTPSPTATSSSTYTPLPSSTPFPTSTATHTPSLTPSVTPSPMLTATCTATSTATPLLPPELMTYEDYMGWFDACYSAYASNSQDMIECYERGMAQYRQNPDYCSYGNITTVRTSGVIFGGSIYLGLGGGVYFLRMTDDTGRIASYIVAEGGIGFGGSLKASLSPTGQAVWSEATLDEIAGWSTQLSGTLFLVSGGTSSSIQDVGCRSTNSLGLSVGIGASMSITGAVQVYDSNW